MLPTTVSGMNRVNDFEQGKMHGSFNSKLGPDRCGNRRNGGARDRIVPTFGKKRHEGGCDPFARQ